MARIVLFFRTMYYRLNPDCIRAEQEFGITHLVQKAQDESYIKEITGDYP
jgi:hypothetical protein